MKVITLNLANYDDHGNWAQRVQMIAESLIDLDPDLVALQEVRFDPDQESTRGSYQNMAEEVLRAIRRHPDGEAWAGTAIVTQPSMYYPVVDSEENPWRYPQPSTEETAVQKWEGLSSLSRGGVLETGSIFLTKNADCTDNNRRSTQVLAVDGVEDPLFLFNTHFSTAEACRGDNVLETLAFMSRFAGRQLLVGDLNATPDDVTLEPLREAGLVDLWQELEGDAAGDTYPADDPSERIDYCWANQEMAERATKIERILTEPDADDVYASDHLGLSVTFDL